MDTLDYGNGDSIQYEYDKMGRVTKQTYEDGETVSYQYDNNGALATVTDSETGIKTTYYYDFTDRMMKYVESGDGYTHSVGYEYDQLNNLTTLVETINGADRTTSYRYDDDNRLISEEVDNMEILYEYDGFGRVSTQTIKEGETVKQTNTYGYADGSAENTTSTQVTSYNDYTYTYDDNGNILSVNDGTYTTSYVYDSQNQLLRENNQAKNFTKVWTYDNAGNIQSRTEYAYTTGTPGTPTDTVNYAYENSDWGDLLTSYDGKTFTYDGVGNLLSDGEWTYTWKHGRQLESMSITYSGGSTDSWTYTYDANGMRTSRVRKNGYTYKYVYNGNQLSSVIINNTVCHLTYDANGIPLTMTYGNATYYYVTNLQGDVIGIKNSNGVQVTTYSYDAWGKMYASSTSPVIMYNPLTYRGYVYDRETGLYYLQSRYYDPEIGRFINADAQVSGVGGDLIGYNQFAYCFNNPVNLDDASGNWPKWAKKVAAAVAVVAVVAVVAAVTVATAGAGSAIAAVAVGAAKGAAIGFAVGAATGAAVGYAKTGTLEGTLNSMADGALTGSISGTITGGIDGGLSYNPGATSTGKGFDTYKQLKNEIGSPGAGNEWHHIVEQSQIEKSGFSPQMIQNTNNVIPISKTTHRAISGYYSSIQPFTNGMTVRNWLAGQSFSTQFEFGMNVIKMFM